MKHFIRNHGLIENLCAHGKIKFPRRHFVNIFSTIIFLFAFSLSHSQQNFLPAFSSSSNFTATNFHHQKNISNHPDYFGESNASEKTFATITSTAAGGNWDDPNTWVGNTIPTQNDDVVIDNGATVTVNVGTAECKNIVINGTLSFNAGMLLEVYGNLQTTGHSMRHRQQ